MRSKLLRARWDGLVRGVPLDDLIGLLTEEESWLRGKGHDDAADETSDLKEKLIDLRRELRKGRAT